MGKDAPCCEACRQFSDGAIVTERAAPAMAIEPKRTWIVVDRRGESFAEHELAGTRVMIGRVQGNDIVLPDATISKRQCWIDVVDGQAIVSDSHSACGTYLDGRKVDRAVVREGSVISVGDFELRLVAR